MYQTFGFIDINEDEVTQLTSIVLNRRQNQFFGKCHVGFLWNLNVCHAVNQ